MSKALVVSRMSTYSFDCPAIPDVVFTENATPVSRWTQPSLVTLPKEVKDYIWTMYFEETILSSCMMDPGITVQFVDCGRCQNLPLKALNGASIIKILLWLKVSKQYYQDATDVFFGKYLSRMVVLVHSLEEFEKLECYALHRCPDLFVRFTWVRREYSDTGVAVHELQYRYVISDIQDDGITTTSYMVKAPFRELLTQYEAMSHRSSPQFDLNFLTADGRLGDIHWVIHAFVDTVLRNRASWFRSMAVVTDFLIRVDYWAIERGITTLLPFKIGIGMAVDITCKTKDEWMKSNMRAKAVAQEWRFEHLI